MLADPFGVKVKEEEGDAFQHVENQHLCPSSCLSSTKAFEIESVFKNANHEPSNFTRPF
jgi:hypothetical protein